MILSRPFVIPAPGIGLGRGFPARVLVKQRAQRLEIARAQGLEELADQKLVAAFVDSGRHSSSFRPWVPVGRQ